MLKSISCHDRLYVDSPQKQQIQDICLSAGHIVFSTAQLWTYDDVFLFWPFPICASRTSLSLEAQQYSQQIFTVGLAINYLGSLPQYHESGLNWYVVPISALIPWKLKLSIWLFVHTAQCPNPTLFIQIQVR